MNDAFFLLLQINDAAFPIGAYAHSFGIETYIRKGVVHDAPSAENCVTRLMETSVLYSGLLAAALAWDAAAQGDVAFLEELEELSAASKAPLELREASLKLGTRFAKTAAALLHGNLSGGARQIPTASVFDAYSKARGKGRISHAPAYGVFCAAAGIHKEEALGAFLYAQTAAMVTCCVKTIPLSQSDGQSILGHCRGRFQGLLEKCPALTQEDLFRSCPGLDIRSMEHEKLSSRLYMS
jgi:urease accessory protein